MSQLAFNISDLPKVAPTTVESTKQLMWERNKVSY